MEKRILLRRQHQLLILLRNLGAHGPQVHAVVRDAQQLVHHGLQEQRVSLSQYHHVVAGHASAMCDAAQQRNQVRPVKCAHALRVRRWRTW